MRLLVTGFEPFGKETCNPSWEAAARLPEQIAGTEIIVQALPVEFIRAETVLEQAIARFHPDAVLCVGQAGGRTQISVEKAALNLRDARIPDNAGYRPVDEPVCPDGPAAYFSTLPVK